MTDWPNPEGDDARPLPDGVAALLRALRGSPTAQELVGEEQVVAAMSVVVPRSSRRKDRSMRTRVITTRAAAFAAGGVMLFTGAAAAASGSLPGPVQSFAHAVASPVLDLPSGGHGARTAAARSLNPSYIPWKPVMSSARSVSTSAPVKRASVLAT